MHSYFWSHNNGSDAIQSVLAKNPMLRVNFTTMCVIESELLVIEFLHCGEAELSNAVLCCGNMHSWAFCSCDLGQWPSYMNLTHIPWRYTRYANINFLPYVIFHKLSSDRHTCIHTDRQTRPKLYTTLLCGRSVNHEFVSITALFTEKSNVAKLSSAHSSNPHQHYNYCQKHSYANNMETGRMQSVVVALWLLAWPPLWDATHIIAIA